MNREFKRVSWQKCEHKIDARKGYARRRKRKRAVRDCSPRDNKKDGANFGWTSTDWTANTCVLVGEWILPCDKWRWFDGNPRRDGQVTLNLDNVFFRRSMSRYDEWALVTWLERWSDRVDLDWPGSAVGRWCRIPTRPKLVRRFDCVVQREQLCSWPALQRWCVRGVRGVR